MRVLLMLLLVTAAFAGCTGGDDTTTTTSTTGSTTTTTSTTTSATTSSTSSTTTTTTTTSAPAENHAPTATLSATTENGTFNVTFDIDGADEDGDDLSWSLDADGDGTADAEGEGDLPAQYVHDYGEAGNFTATLTVSDGEEDAMASVDVTLEATGGETGQTVEGSFTAGGHFCAAAPPTWEFGSPAAGTVAGEWEVAPDTIGLDFSASLASADTPIILAALSFYDADASFIEYADGAESIEGTVPDGSAYALLTTCGGAMVSYTYHAA